MLSALKECAEELAIIRASVNRRFSILATSIRVIGYKPRLASLPRRSERGEESPEYRIPTSPDTVKRLLPACGCTRISFSAAFLQNVDQ
jgi:hypothetical protein